MTRLIFALAAFLALTGTGQAGGLDDARWCAKGTGDRDLDRYFCTLAIDSGDLSTETLAITFNNRGITYNEKGDYDRAIEDYDRAIRLDSDFALAFNNKAWVLATASNAQVRDGREAVRLAREAVRLERFPINLVHTLS
ncbi:MAG: tetratricopeptide repeat protein [Proteobacteria bacterium]|nr:tetratricopeptide repeat protein [Pseudomonadota bacterium]